MESRRRWPPALAAFNSCSIAKNVGPIAASVLAVSISSHAEPIYIGSQGDIGRELIVFWQKI